MLMFNSLIDGEWLSDGARAPNVNPSDTKDIVGEAARGTRAQAEAAIAAAKTAFPAWSRSTPQVRYDILKKASDEIADEAVEMTAFEDFVTEEVRKGRSILGLYPATDEQTPKDFAAWRKANGR